MKEKKFSLGVWAFGPCGDRFLTQGYRPETSVEEALRRAATIEDLSGVEVGYPSNVNEDNLDTFREVLRETRLVVSMVGVDLAGDRR